MKTWWLMLGIIMACLYMLSFLSGCSTNTTKVSNSEQVLIGAAIGGTLACAPGAAVGALAGYAISEFNDEENK